MAKAITITSINEKYSYGPQELRAHNLLISLYKSLSEGSSPFISHVLDAGEIIMSLVDPELDFTRENSKARVNKLWIIKNLVEITYSKLYQFVKYEISIKDEIKIRYMPGEGSVIISSNIFDSQLSNYKKYSLILGKITEQYINIKKQYLDWSDSGITVNSPEVDETNFFLFPLFQ